MEIKRREKTLAGLFLTYVGLFCVGTLFLAGMLYLLINVMAVLGFVLPANYAERQLTEHAAEIREAGMELEKWIPQGCTYGVYDKEGEWLSGSFPKEEQKSAFEHYQKDNMYGEKNGYYRFIYQDNGNVCIVRYRLLMRYSSPALNEFLPLPERMMPFVFFFLFFVYTFFLSGKFAKKMKAQLSKLQRVTEKIAKNDLEFETVSTNIRELDEVMESLTSMRDALKKSLEDQWDMEREKQVQLSALAHDIKTPLTVIKGNAELLAEGELPAEGRACASYILANVKDMEGYLEGMRQVLSGGTRDEAPEVLSCENLGELLGDLARQFAQAGKLPISFDIKDVKGEVCCKRDCILRAFRNILSNAGEYTDRERGIQVFVRQESRDGQLFFVAGVLDYGRGFSPEDLKYGDREFYSGDKSRHDRAHQGLGLSIAKRFVEEQGGFLEYGNCGKNGGAVVELCMRLW